MTQMTFDDLTVPVEQVIKQEGTAKTGEQLFWEAELFYRKNPRLLAAHVEAAKLFEEHRAPVSARALTEFVRYLKRLGVDGVQDLASIYEGIDWERDSPYAIANASSAWLSRFLDSKGFDVAKAKSVIDETWEEVHGNGDGNSTATD